MYKLDVYPEHELVVCAYSEQVTIDEIKAAITELANHPHYARHFDCVCDYRFAHAVFHEPELHQFIKSLKEQDIARGTWALLAGQPLETAMVMIFANTLKERHPVDVFSTIDAASRYLKKDLTPYLKDIYVTHRSYKYAYMIE